MMSAEIPTNQCDEIPHLHQVKLHVQDIVPTLGVRVRVGLELGLGLGLGLGSDASVQVIRQSAALVFIGPMRYFVASLTNTINLLLLLLMLCMRLAAYLLTDM